MLILQWNICGYRSKYADLTKIISETLPDCICMQETMLGQTNPTPPTGYTLIKDQDPSSTPGHGLAVLVSHKYPYNVLNLSTNLQAIAIQIHLDRLVTICNIYISPNEELRQDTLETLIDQLPEPFILLGDFNAKHELWGEAASDARGRVIESLVTETQYLNT